LDPEEDLTALFAACHDGGVETLAETGWHVVNFVRSVDFDRLSRRAEGDLAVFAPTQMLFQFGAHLGGDRFVDEVVKKSDEF
jgi:hypothetical protein